MPDRSDPRFARRGLPSVMPFDTGLQPPLNGIIELVLERRGSGHELPVDWETFDE